MGAWEWDIPQGNIKWDAQMLALFGVSEFTGGCDEMLALIDARDQVKINEGLHEAVAACAEYDAEFRVTRGSDQSPRVLRLRAKVHCDEKKNPLRAFGVCWDITERRRTEEALTWERHLFTTLMENLPDAIYFKDRESHFIAVNREMAKWFGVSDPSQIVGRSDFDFFSEEHAHAAFEDERKIVSSGEPMIGIEEKETWPDGHESWVISTKLPLRDPNGEIIGTFGLSRNITARKHAEEQLAKANEELRKKNETLEQDLELARELQSAMLPQRYPGFLRGASDDDSAVHFYHFFRPSMSVSGDFFDVLKISEDVAGLFICDVMGHGVRAALVAATIRAIVGELRYTWSDPAEFLEQLNRAIRSTLKHAGMPLFASASYVVADLGRRELRYANAGHPNPLCMHHTGETVQPVPLNGCKPGPVLGLFDNPTYQVCRRDLLPHDVVLVFTDGLFEVEGRDGQLFDYPRLMTAVNNRSTMATVDLCRGVIDEVQQFAANREFTDDVCLVAMEIERLVAG